MGAFHPDEIDVGSCRGKERMKADRPAPAGDGGDLQVRDRHRYVGHAHLEAMAQESLAFQGDGLPQYEITHPGHEQFDAAALDFGLYGPGQGLKGHLRRGDAV